MRRRARTWPRRTGVPRAVFLDAANSQGQYGTTFSVIGLRDGGKADFGANVSERVDRVQIHSSVNIRAPRTSFTYDVEKERAAVTPPAPFSGSAELSRGPNGRPIWTGDLTVDIAGYGVAPLTGPDFQAGLMSGSVVFFGPGNGGWSRPQPLR